MGSFHSFEGHFVISISFQFLVNEKSSHADAIQLSFVRTQESGAVSYRDSTWFFHFKVIPMIQMRSEWKNRLLSLIETAPDSFISRSFPSHSQSFWQSSAKFVFEFLNDDRMTEWWQNDRHLRIHFFSLSPKTPPFLLIPSFHIIFEWKRMKISMGILHSTVILIIFTSLRHLSSS